MTKSRRIKWPPGETREVVVCGRDRGLGRREAESEAGQANPVKPGGPEERVRV